MKNKIIAIIICITIITSVLCISCFAEVNHVYPDTKYTLDQTCYNNNATEFNTSLNVSGRMLFNSQIWNFEKFEIFMSSDKHQYSKIQLYRNTQDETPLITINQITENDIIFIFYNITNFTLIKYIVYETPKDYYENTDDFLTYIITCITSIVNYCITNTVILVVISIVFVSFAVGILIRINRKKF